MVLLWVPHSLGPTLANVFMCHFENIWLENCPTQFKPVVYRSYVDDTFLLFCSTEHAEKFENILTSSTKTFPLHLKWSKMLIFH